MIRIEPLEVPLCHWLQEQSKALAQGVFCVRSHGSHGYLHLCAGVVVQGEIAQTRGEEAVLEILSWARGAISFTARSVVSQRAFELTLDALLLKVRKRMDELAYAENSRPPPPVIVPNLSLVPPPLPTSTSSKPASSPSTPNPTWQPVADILLGREGQLIEARGRSIGNFSARVAYANRIALLIGQALGSGTPLSLELRSRSSKMVICNIAESHQAASWCSLEPKPSNDA